MADRNLSGITICSIYYQHFIFRKRLPVLPVLFVIE